jgi:hypothetical protein
VEPTKVFTDREMTYERLGGTDQIRNQSKKEKGTYFGMDGTCQISPSISNCKSNIENFSYINAYVVAEPQKA